MTATFFLISSQVGAPGFVTWDDARSLFDSGMEIGSHSVSHRPLTAVSDADLEHELLASRQALAGRVGADCAHLSLPFGFATHRVLDAALQQYATVSTSDFGLNDAASESRSLRRISLRSGMGPSALGPLLNPRSAPHIMGRLRDTITRPIKRFLLYGRPHHGLDVEKGAPR